MPLVISKHKLPDRFNPTFIAKSKAQAEELKRDLEQAEWQILTEGTMAYWWHTEGRFKYRRSVQYGSVQVAIHSTAPINGERR
jgi:hypothetical protein